MGSDVYDKLLILQALRPHFPDVIFFTTDLDGRFLDPEVKKWTQNLVVTSSFGLTLRQDLQRDAAPFRNSYQTSLYFASLEALQVVPCGLRELFNKPRRFEIGRVHAVDLSVDNVPKGIHPTPDRAIHPAAILFTASLAAVGAWLLVTFVPPLRRTFRTYERQYQRQSPVFFTEKDILDPRAVVDTTFPWEVPPRPALPTARPAPGLPSVPQSARLTVMHWLNAILLSRQGDAGKVPPEKREVFLGPPETNWPFINGPLRSFRLLRHTTLRAETERLVARRLALEEILSSHVGTCEHRCRLLNENLTSAPVGVVVVVVGILVFLGLMITSSLQAKGEPFSFTEGVSVWPCEILRALALVLTVTFLIKAQLDLRMREVSIAEDFFLRRKSRTSSRHTGIAWTGRWVRRSSYPWLAAVLAWPAYLWTLSECYPSMSWFGAPGPVRAQRLWNHYRDRGRTLSRLARSGTHVVMYLAFCGLTLALSHEALFVPARGALARGLDGGLLVVVVFLFLLLNFLVADAVRLTRGFIRVLIQGETEWPEATLEAERERLDARSTTDVVEWLDIQFIGHLTRSISGLVFYPAIILCLLIVARTRYFDAWHWSWALVVIFGFNACWPLASAFLLQTAAVAARQDALEKLYAKLVTAKASTNEKHIKALEEMIGRVESYREGAFTNYLDNPALKALLVPFTGAGVMNIVNLLTTS